MLYDTIDNFIVRLPKLLPVAAELVPLLRAVRAQRSFEELAVGDFGAINCRFGEYDTKPGDEIPYEAHRKYWDLQIVIEGREQIGFAPLERLDETVPYREDDDIAFYGGRGQDLRLEPGVAILLAPWDAHRPGGDCADGRSHVKKIVVKLPW